MGKKKTEELFTEAFTSSQSKIELESDVDDACKSCKANLVLSDEGFMLCVGCGLMVTDVLDQSAEWRFYGADHNGSEDPTRCGMPTNPLLEESSLGCKVGYYPNSSYEMRKIRQYNEWQSMPYKEKSQYDEFQLITTMAQNGGISKLIIDDAIRYHKKISEHKTFRGLNRDGIIAASIYISCRTNNHPRTAKEIAGIFKLDSRSSTRGCKNAMSIINTLERNDDEKTVLCNTRPESFIERYCSRLNINAELTKICQFMSIKIENDKLIPENTPHSIAAGIVYFVSQMANLNVTRKDVNLISDISEVTVKKCYGKIDKIKELVLPKVILQKYAPVVEPAASASTASTASP